MFDTIIGCIIGTIVSIIIAHIYYKKATDDLEQLKLDIKSETDKLIKISEFISEDTAQTQRDAEMIKKHVTNNTIDDPDFPYK